MVAAARRAEEAARRRRSVVDFCEALVGELRAGQPVLAALERSAPVWPEVASLGTAARLDADLPSAFRRLARSPGAESLAHLAAAWQLCARTGGGLTSAAALVLESARADAAALRQVEGEVSSARATARLVAALPVVVLSAGQGLGGRPWAFLLGHPAGVTCLGCGVALVFAGLAWIDRIAAAATSEEG
jgi:tight adherence protein B